MAKSNPSRREFMELSAASLAAMSALGATARASSRRRPNIVLIFLDDLGSIDLNCYGAHDLITPHFDALAKSGMRLTQFYSGSPICSASRGATLTGRYPQRNGLTNNASSEPGIGAALPASERTIAAVLKDAGYATGHVGKWHLGYTADTIPTAHGFQSSFGHMGGCIDNYSHFFYWDGPNRHDLWSNTTEIHCEGQFFGDLMVEKCKEFISSHKDHPFFLYWAINEPHYPLQGKAQWREKYKHLPSPRNMYAAMVSTADELLGQVLAHLDSLGLRDDTLIIFQSDHGHSTEIRSFGGGGNAGPYRGAKFSLFEGGIRVPAIVSYPPSIPKNQVRDQFVTGVDWLPTMLALADVPLPNVKLDGQSVLPILKSADAPGSHHTYHWQLAKQWAVRDGNWKLIGNPNDTSHKAPIGPEDQLFLSDLSRDVTEMHNLAAQHPDKVGQLLALHKQWLTEMDHAAK